MVKWAPRLLVLGCVSLLAPTWLLAQTSGADSGVAPAQPGSITGIVTQAETGVPIGDALVIVEGAGRAVRTRANGRFVIDGIPRGRYTLRARQFGYRDAALWVRVEDGQQTEQVVVLAPNPLELQGIIVTGEARNGLVGVVVDEVSRRPIVDALVSVEPRAAARQLTLIVMLAVAVTPIDPVARTSIVYDDPAGTLASTAKLSVVMLPAVDAGLKLPVMPAGSP